MSSILVVPPGEGRTRPEEIAVKAAKLINKPVTISKPAPARLLETESERRARLERERGVERRRHLTRMADIRAMVGQLQQELLVTFHSDPGSIAMRSPALRARELSRQIQSELSAIVEFCNRLHPSSSSRKSAPKKNTVGPRQDRGPTNHGVYGTGKLLPTGQGGARFGSHGHGKHK